MQHRVKDDPAASCAQHYVTCWLLGRRVRQFLSRSCSVRVEGFLKVTPPPWVWADLWEQKPAAVAGLWCRTCEKGGGAWRQIHQISLCQGQPLGGALGFVVFLLQYRAAAERSVSWKVGNLRRLEVDSEFYLELQNANGKHVLNPVNVKVNQKDIIMWNCTVSYVWLKLLLKLWTNIVDIFIINAVSLGLQAEKVQSATNGPSLAHAWFKRTVALNPPAKY